MTDRADKRWDHQLVAADVYDCYSLKAAEKTGYNGAYLSIDDIAECVCGLQETWKMSSEEFLWVAKRVISFANMPVIAEIRNGFGVRAESAARIAGRLAKAGASAVWIDDSVFQDEGHRIAGAGWERRIELTRREMEGSFCRLACTVHLDGEPLEKAAEKCRQAVRLGADLTGISGLRGMEDARKFSELVEGPKIWVGADQRSINTKELEKLGYRLILDCYSVAGALEGMRLFGRRTQEDGNTVFHDRQDFDGMLPTRSHYDLFEFYKLWIPLERHFFDVDWDSHKIREWRSGR